MRTRLMIGCFAILLFTASCETVVDVEIPERPQALVVNSYLSTDRSTVNVDLSETASVLSEGSFTSISGATIDLAENGQTIDTFTELSPGFYSSNVTPVPGRQYQLTVSMDGFETVTANNTIPEEHIMTSAAPPEQVVREGFEQTRLRITISDPPGVRNYYEIGVFIYFNTIDPQTGEFNESDSIAGFSFIELDGAQFEDSPDQFGSTILIDDALFDGNDETIDILYDSFFDFNIEDQPVFYYMVRNTSEAYYDYARTRKIHAFNSGDPFAEPIPVIGNIENGYGVFAGYQTFIKEVPR